MVIPKLTFVFDRKGQATKKKSSVVELRISAGKVRKYISTGVKLFYGEWKDGSVVGRKDWKELNDQLQAIRKHCSEIVTKMIEDGNLDLNAIPSILKNELIQQETFIDYAKELAERRYKTISSGTKNHYKVLFSFLDSCKGLVYFSDITERNILKMDDELTEKGLQAQTRWNYHKLVKSFIIQAVEDGLIKRNPYSRLEIKRGNENGLTRYLTPVEFHRFETCIIPTESLRKVRDLFIFQTYTCLSYSDLEEFDYKKCVKVNGLMVYKGRRVKTGQEFTIVLLKPALEILKKYKNKLPVISNVKYNLYLKAAVKYAMIDKPVSTHWARHTGATILLNEGNIPMHIVQHILGHATIKETEKTYAKVLDGTIVEAMATYQTDEDSSKKKKKKPKVG
jgi:integrase